MISPKPEVRNSKQVRIFKILILILFSVSILGFKTSALAVASAEVSGQIESIRREREALVAEQRRLQAELDDLNRQSQNLGTAVKSLDATKRKLAADIKITQSRIRSTDVSIRVLEKNIADKSSKIETHEQAIILAIQTISQHDVRPLWMDVIASTNLSDIWRDRTQLESLSVDLNGEVANLRETKTVLSEEKKKKEEARRKIASLQSELAGQKTVVEESQKAKERLLAETKNKEALYQQMLAENLRRQEEAEKDMLELASQLNLKVDRNLIPRAGRGILSWPLEKIFLTQQFGKTSASGRLYASGTHNGIDFRASQGTPVKAMLGGIVEGTGNTDLQKGCYSYGGWVLIRHSNGLSSVYAHLSAVLVQKGQRVETGDIIAYSGGTPRVFGSGYSTGPHLHVGLFASHAVSIQQFTTSKNCKQVYIPIADTDAYLDPLAYLPNL